MKVTIIIPVFNAAPFLDKGIQSALDQKQTGEVLLIDDRSTDNSLEICKKWEKMDNRVKVFVNEGTKGAGAARNIGLLQATCAFIAFLDADDYYLDGRFDETEKIFNSISDAEAVAESVLVQHKGIIGQSKVLDIVYNDGDIIGVKEQKFKIDLNHFLFKECFYITGLTIKKNVIGFVGPFDQKLIQTQDTDFIYNLLLNARVYTGDFKKPVVVQFRHKNNITNNTHQAIYYRRMLAKKRFIFFIKDNFNFKIAFYFFKKIIEYDYLMLYNEDRPYKKIFKIFLLPFSILRIILPEQNKN